MIDAPMGHDTNTLSLTTSLEESGLLRLDKKNREGYEKLGLVTIGDALTHFPRRHEDRTRFDRFPEGGMEQAVCLLVLVSDCRSFFGRGQGRRCFEVTVEPVGGDLLGNRLILRWFNMPYLAKVLAVGHRLVIYGQPKESKGRVLIDHPDFEIVEDDEATAEPHMGRIVPIYPLASGVGQKPLRSLIHRLLALVPDEAITEWLPPGAGGTLTRAAAIRALHYPASMAELEPARRRLALEEFTALQLELLRRRAEFRQNRIVPRPDPESCSINSSPSSPSSPPGRSAGPSPRSARTSRSRCRWCGYSRVTSERGKPSSPPRPFSSSSRRGPTPRSWPRPRSWQNNISAPSARGSLR
jgi:RecG-like helicase